ncbi:S9 family peptidase [Massilia sp. 9I]|uniref:alpha/beta hydrolase family protein n=1 Tax=Massilia sp. 9I TaxID=2653152 RepID=UPI0012EFF390|nr:alpha/beta fold hydrolase [Massilia sp. 9I]VXB22409.1 Hydrolase alpha/beta fold family protein [Massilia sp. 9I]
MKSTLLGILAALALATHPAHAIDATGHWKGSIAGSLHLFLEFGKAADGKWEGTLKVPQQGLSTKVDQLEVGEEQLGFKLLALNAGFTARWSEQEKAWMGSWSQNGQSIPLRLERSDAAAGQPKRPQSEAIAARQAAYASSEVRFTNPAGGHSLAGTFTVPQGRGPFPAVVLVHGSGPNDRDQTILDHKLFLVLADHLSSRGIAVLRYDKRGVKQSGGVYKDATTQDFASDAEAAVAFLRGRADVDPARIGVIGHSEGGLIAPMVAARDPKLGFVVMLAGPGVRGELLMVEQIALAAKARGVPDALVDQERELNRAVFAAIVAEPQAEAAEARARQLMEEGERKGILPPGTAAARARAFSTPWFQAFLRHEPGPGLRAIRQPILVLNGERDLQVPAAMDLAPIRTALKDNPRAVVKELPALNHLFQTARTGAGSEYAEIEESFAPLALNTISDWILATVKRPRSAK